LSFGGNDGSNSAVTEEYNGTSWSAGGNLATARYGLGGAGTQTAGLSFGGYTGSYSAITEEYSNGYPIGEQSSSTPNWSATGATTLRTMDTIVGTSQASLAGSSNAISTAQNGFLGYFCSPKLSGAQNVSSGSMVFLAAEAESNASSNFCVNGLEIYVWRPSTGAKVGTVKAFSDTSLGGTEPTAASTEQTTYLTGISTTGVSASNGDVIVCEVWSRHTQGMSTSYTDTFYYDGTTTYTAENSATASCASYIELAANLTFQGTAAALEANAAAIATATGALTTGIQLAANAAAIAGSNGDRTGGKRTQ
jgi:hypothetical protein